MGILSHFTNAGSQLSRYDGATPPHNPLTTKKSPLHAVDTTPGYSLDGDFYKDVKLGYSFYNNDPVFPYFIPAPSKLDINGVNPKTALRDKNVTSINNTFSKGLYIDNLPK